MPSLFQQCLEPGNTLTTELCSEELPLNRLSNHLIRNQ